MCSMKYSPLDYISEEEVNRILTEGNLDEVILLPLRVGEFWTDWSKAQGICLKLMDHENDAVRANAALGLAYIARICGKLDKRLVKPYLLRELKRNESYKWRIEDSISDINIYLGWHLCEEK